MQVAKSCNDNISKMCYLVNSEWLVKARGNQSPVRIELIGLRAEGSKAMEIGWGKKY